MTKNTKFLTAAVFTGMLALATGLATTAYADAPKNSLKLLSAQFEKRNVVQIELGDFHFKPGQVAPVHTHKAPAVGYVTKGSIIYQVEGEREQILREGDAFYEPVGPRILRFDNASATQEAIFIDINLEQKGEPFIVFPKPLTEKIDRRTLPTIAINGKNGKEIKQVDIFSNELAPKEKLSLTNRKTMIGLVAEGVIELRIKGKKTQRIVAGRSYSLPDSSISTIVNASSEIPAKVITFQLN